MAKLNHKECRKIRGTFDDKTIRIYQAYNDTIADEAVNLGTFGPSFDLDRMTWIKPSFLWMMYRSGWGTKEEQVRILAVDILREGFEEILSDAILTTFSSDIYPSYDDWKTLLKESEVRCQWDPDRDIQGKPLDRRAIQLGLSGDTVNKYVNQWIVKITDISEEIHNLAPSGKGKRFDLNLLPKEKEYPLDLSLKKILGIKE